jgi:uncharacterized protein
MNEEIEKKQGSLHSFLRSPWFFFALVYCWSWFFWILAAVLGARVDSVAGTTLKLLGLLGPILGGIGFTYFTQSKENWYEYWSRAVDPRRIAPKWYLVILLFVPGILALSLLLDIVLNGTADLTLVGRRVTPFLSAPATIIPFVFGVFISGPLTEEFGWRGYVLDRLQARWNALTSSLILGVIWAIWHVPLFFMQGSRHETEGAWSMWFWLFIVGVVATSVIFTWIFNNTRRSILGAIIFHFVANLTYELSNVTAGTNLYACMFWVLAAISVVVFWGPATLTRNLAGEKDVGIKYA